MASDRDDPGAGDAASREAELRTFLIADVRGYTRYTHERGDEAAADLAARFADRARHAIEEHGGELLELRGDEALGVFTSPRAALRAAVRLQALVRGGDGEDPALPLGVGIGLDAGEAVAVEGGYRGGALNLAARLCSLAAPGEILTSETVVGLARKVDGIRYEERGTQRLKGLERPVTVVEVVREAERPGGRRASFRRFRRKHVTRGRVAAAIVVAVIAAVAVGAAATRLGGGDATPEAAGVRALDPASLEETTGIPLGTSPSSVAIGEGSIWVLDADDKTISQIDSKSHELTRTFSTSSTPTGIAAGAGALWVSNAGTGTDLSSVVPTSVSRIDPSSGVIIETIDLPPAPQGSLGFSSWISTQSVAVSRDAVWVINPDLTLSRIDPRSNEVVARVKDVRAVNIGAGDGELWVTEQGVGPQGDARVARIDQSANAVAWRSDAVGGNLSGVAAGGGAVWVTDTTAGNVVRIDSRSGTLTGTIPLDTWVSHITFGEGAVWATNEVADTVYRLEPRTGAAERIEQAGSPRGIAAGDGSVWVATTAPPSRNEALPRSVCGDVHFDGTGEPDVLIVSDLTLKGEAREVTQPLAAAVRFILEQRGFEAGPFSVGYQSCDNSTAQTGEDDLFRCGSNAKAYTRSVRVVAILGSSASSCSYVQIPITNVAEEGPLAMLSPSATWFGLTDVAARAPTGVPSFFRLVAPDGDNGSARPELAKQLGAERLFVLVPRTDGFDGELLSLKATARRVGVTVVGIETFDPDAASHPGLAKRVAASKPEHVAILGGLTTASLAVLRGLRAELGRDTTISIGRGDGLPLPDARVAGRAAAGLYVLTHGVPNDRLPPRGKQFLDAFAAANGGDAGPDAGASYGAQAAEILLDAIARSDGTRASVTEELRHTDVRGGILGDVSWDRTGELHEAPITVLRVTNDGIVTDRVIVVRRPRNAP